MEEKLVGRESARGVSTKAYAIPILVFVAIVLVFIVLVIVDINRSTNRVFDLMQSSRAYQLDATSMQASNTVMSETCNNYIMMPVDDENMPMIGSLMAYVKELDSDRRSPKVAERFRGYNVSEEVLNCVINASKLSEEIKDIQIHAISLMASVHPLPPISDLTIFSSYTLTQEELEMTPTERESYARSLILQTEYAQRRYHINEYIEICCDDLQNEFLSASELYGQHLIVMRAILWASISAIVLILSIAFTLLHFYILKPLRHYSKQISSNESIKETRGLSEMKRLVNAFNGLWNYRNKVESILRNEAENDSLTGLPNRYCMERDLAREDLTNKSLTILMFDVNFLKRTNDVEGHLAGDNLIKTAASCIKECFGIESFNNCYRIGGDEFVSLIFGVDESEIKRRIEKFKYVLNRENISISVGYAFSAKDENKNFKELMDEADKKMYKQKKKIHSEQ